MRSFNIIQIGGYLGRDPEVRYLPDGTPVCNFSIATNEKIKEEDLTTWFECTAWRNTAETIGQHLQKGDPIFVYGRLHEEPYTDKDGFLAHKLKVNVSGFQFLSNKDDTTGREPRSAKPPQRRQATPSTAAPSTPSTASPQSNERHEPAPQTIADQAAAAGAPITEDDIPF